jgi:energy-coupling factor transport system ATP-binding protein
VRTANGDTSAGNLRVPALSFRGVGFRYAADAPRVLDGLDLDVEPGEFVALVGGNGSGKTTLARLANGLLVPEEGEVRVEGLHTGRPDTLWEVRRRVGLLFQDPEDQIVGASVEDDVAFGLENLGVPREEMRRRVSEAIARVGLGGEEDREPHLLSGGQKQRLALAAVLVLRPSVLVLDEPTSMLDAAGREETLGFVRELVSGGVAVLMITQHMEESLLADRLVYLEAGRVAFEGLPADFFRSGRYRETPLGPPPVAALARYLRNELAAAQGRQEGAETVTPPAMAAGSSESSAERGINEYDGLPLTEDELLAFLREAVPPEPPARRAVGRGDAATEVSAGACRAPGGPAPRSSAAGAVAGAASAAGGEAAPSPPLRTEDAAPSLPLRAEDVAPLPPAVDLAEVELVYGAGLSIARRALHQLDLRIEQGTVVGVVGPTAAGKSTLLQITAGLLSPTSGAVSILGRERPGPGQVAMVFQRPEIQLFAATVHDDVAMAPKLAGVEGEALQWRVERALRLVGLDPVVFADRSPHSLSLGEQRRAAIAGVLSLDPRVLVLDEPGSGLDPRGRRALLARLLSWARGGPRPGAGALEPPPPSQPGAELRTLVFTSHDLDEVAEASDVVVVLQGGRLLAVGPPGILADSGLVASAGLRPPLVARLAAGLGLPEQELPVRASGLVQAVLAEGGR